MPAAWLWGGTARGRRASGAGVPEGEDAEPPELTALRDRCSALERGLAEAEVQRARLAEALDAERSARLQDVAALKVELAALRHALAPAAATQAAAAGAVRTAMPSAPRRSAVPIAEEEEPEPAAEEPEEPAAEEPAAEAPAAEEPAAEKPPADEPAATEAPAGDEPAAEEPVTEEPAAEEPAADEPAAEEPAAEEAVAEEPAVDEPAAEEPAAEEPAAEKQAVDEPAAEEPEMPAAEEPAAEEPAAEETVAAVPAASSSSDLVPAITAALAGEAAAPAARLAASASAGVSAQARLLFSVSCDTQPGTHVRVVGNHEDLGAWDPARALPLATTPETYPEWRCRRGITIKAHAQLEYKYVLCDEDMACVQWEEGENRHVTVAAAGECTVVTDTFGAREASTSEACSAPPRWAQSNWPSEISSGTDAEPPLLEPEQEQDCMSDHTPRTSVPEDLPSPLRLTSLQSSPDPELESVEAAEPPRPEAAAPGPDFSRRYRLAGDRPLGEGSFGFVYRCSREHCSDVFAAKLIRRSCLLPRDISNLLGPQGEVRTHQALYHQNIVRFIEHFDEPETIALVMECCEGGDLYEAIEDARRSTGRGLSEVATSVVMRHMLSALAYLHRLCIAHRDVKAENVLLSKAGVPHEQNVYKICDFGFAARDDGHNHGLSGGIGSPFTVAPEVVSGKSYGCPVDIWSAGVLMYVTLAATLPFDGETQREVLQRVLAARYQLEGPFWDALPAPCKGFLAALLAKNPDDRPTATKALRHVWLSMLA